jgi:hypothetical protein
MESDVAARVKNRMIPPRITMGAIREIRVSMKSDVAKRVIWWQVKVKKEMNTSLIVLRVVTVISMNRNNTRYSAVSDYRKLSPWP